MKFRRLKKNESKRYKYELTQNQHVKLTREFPDTALLPWLRIANDAINIRDKYQWDGASGPAIDTDDWMLASLVHDALYQLLRERKLPMACRKNADKQMLDLLKAAGMPWWRRGYSYIGVRIAGGIRIRRDWK